jgi:hypothetical protein
MWADFGQRDDSRSPIETLTVLAPGPVRIALR